MKYLCLIYVAADVLEQVSATECLAYAASLRERGHCLAAEALRAREPTTTVRASGGEVVVTDGPYAETKEILAGFYLLDAWDLNEAIQLAADSPPLQFGRVELRPILETEARA